MRPAPILLHAYLPECYKIGTGSGAGSHGMIWDIFDVTIVLIAPCD